MGAYLKIDEEVERYDLPVYYSGEPTASLILWRAVYPLAVTIPAGMSGSRAVARVAATAETIFNVRKNGSNFGTITFAAAGTVGTVAAALATAFVAGDVIDVVAPASPDDTLADIAIMLCGSR